MKKLLNVVCGLVLLISISPVGAVTLSLQPSSQIAAPTDIVTLDLVIDGLGDFAPDSLGDFDINIAYDPSTLSFQSFNLGSFLGDIGLGEATDFSSGDLGGIINVAEVSLLEPDASTCTFCIPPFLDDIQPSSFSLATFQFMVAVLAPGDSTTVSIDTVFALGDGFGLPLVLDATSDAVITAVPIPPAVWLFGSGLLGLIAIARKKAA